MVRSEDTAYPGKKRDVIGGLDGLIVEAVEELVFGVGGQEGVK